MKIFLDNFQYDSTYNRFASYLGVDRFTRKDFTNAKKIIFLYDVYSDGGKKGFRATSNNLERARQNTNVLGKTLVDFLYARERFRLMGTKPETT